MNVTEVQPVSQTENISTANSNRCADDSFNKELKKAQDGLDNKNKISSKTWHQIESLIGITPLKFNFETNLDADYGSEKSKENYKPNSSQNCQTQDATKQQSRMTQQPEQNDKFETNNLKVIKEILANFMPNPVVPPSFFFGNLETSGTTSNIVSKIDLQLLIDQIAEQAKLVKSQRKVELALMLREEHLGKIDLSFASRNGFVSIQIAASPELNKSLQDSLPELEAALNLAHIKFDQIKIKEVQKYDEHSFAS